MAYFLNKDIESIDAHTALMHDRDMLAQRYGKFPHEIDNMPIRDYWIAMEISSAQNEKTTYDKDIKDAWKL